MTMWIAMSFFVVLIVLPFIFSSVEAASYVSTYSTTSSGYVTGYQHHDPICKIIRSINPLIYNDHHHIFRELHVSRDPTTIDEAYWIDNNSYSSSIVATTSAIRTTNKRLSWFQKLFRSKRQQTTSKYLDNGHNSFALVASNENSSRTIKSILLSGIRTKFINKKEKTSTMMHEDDFQTVSTSSSSSSSSNDNIYNENKKVLFSTDIEIGVKPSIIVGSMMSAILGSIICFGMSHIVFTILFAVPTIAYLSITKSILGDTIRMIGQIVYHSFIHDIMNIINQSSSFNHATATAQESVKLKKSNAITDHVVASSPTSSSMHITSDVNVNNVQQVTMNNNNADTSASFDVDEFENLKLEIIQRDEIRKQAKVLKKEKKEHHKQRYISELLNIKKLSLSLSRNS